MIPLGSAAAVALVDAKGRYRGLVATAEAHGAGDEHEPVSSLARLCETSLTPDLNLREAMDVFETSGSDLLVVTDAEGAVVGTLSEAYAARRYAAAVDRAARGVLGGG